MTSKFKRTGVYYPFKFNPGQLVQVTVGDMAGRVGRVKEGLGYNDKPQLYAYYRLVFLDNKEEYTMREESLRRYVEPLLVTGEITQ